MKRKLILLICLIFLFSVLMPQVANAYQAPTAAQKQEIQDKIDEGNQLKQDIKDKIDKMREAYRADDKEKARKFREEAFDLLDKFEKARQEAIELADKYYKPDATNVKGEPQYDLGVTGEAETSKSGTVKIGENAFENAELLGTTKLHEFVHADQAKSGTWIDGDKSRDMNECEAYDKELEEAAKTGLSQVQIDEIRRRRKTYYDALTAANKRKINARNYDPRGVALIRDAVRFGRARIDFTGKGIAAGDVFVLEITRTTPDAYVLEIPSGTPVCPETEGVQTMMISEDVAVELKEPVTVVEVPGYCLSPDLIPPPTPEQIKEEGKPKPEWTVENQWEYPEKYEIPAEIIKAGKKLSDADKFHTDMPKEKYLKTVVQRALWFDANPEKFNKEKLKEDIAKQVKESGGKQTPEQVENLTNNIWEDVDLTLKEGKNKETKS
ncbi:MAG: hypothetical protein ABIH00_00655 [Armatimonadota bacterium]